MSALSQQIKVKIQPFLVNMHIHVYSQIFASLKLHTSKSTKKKTTKKKHSKIPSPKTKQNPNLQFIFFSQITANVVCTLVILSTKQNKKKQESELHTHDKG